MLTFYAKRNSLYRTNTGKCPLEQFLDSRNDLTQIKILAVFRLVQESEQIPVSFFKKLKGTKLYEIRVEWQSNIYRFPCFFHKDGLVVLTHGFVKKTPKTPKNEITKAENYRRDYQRRNG
ncbi:MAG: type II toxin-antitoxin system RelE/ParE family toxin [Oceanispirochaeta sp.]|nr:type II toxin-antitoxin system RelE/ParE family toxin [Oceanispirochaeta sp.]MDA3957058.1 type II toxin-antitoxin system RelE/ParE family toxin [Oceanispirochaeta sp.]